jgi:hypothetical protein
MTCLMANLHQQCKQVNILTWYPREKLGVYCVDVMEYLSQMTPNMKGKQFLLHQWHLSFLSKYKPADNSWIIKRPESVYDKWNILGVICDRYSITSTQYTPSFSRGYQVNILTCLHCWCKLAIKHVMRKC